MAKFLIEVPHDEEETECIRVVESFLTYGSHFVMNADWGCMDGVHKAWITIEAENKDEARAILPPSSRDQAVIVRLNKFTMGELDEIMGRHKKK